jgi:hypothetical protein
MRKQLETIEELNSTNENRMFYRSVLQIKHGYQPKLKACKDKQLYKLQLTLLEEKRKEEMLNGLIQNISKP